MKAEPDKFRTLPGIPPWMWYWVVIFTLNLPALLGTWYASYEALNNNIRSSELLRAVDPQSGRLPYLSYPGFFTENLPGLALFLGLFTILFPHVRAYIIERRNKLEPPPPSFKALEEIKSFVELHAPGLELKVNLKRPGRIWIYPNGYRRATLAVFSGFVMLWKIDREAAEAVLLHELEHYRRGDALFMGPGDFFENAVKFTLLFYLLFVALPYIFTSIAQSWQHYESLQKIDAIRREINNMRGSVGLEEQPAPSYAPQLITSIFISVVGLLATTASFLMRTTASFVLPVACVWAAEFNADYFASSDQNYRNSILRELSKKQGKLSWWRWILFRLSHPPENLRRLFLRHRDSYAFSLLLLIYPLAMFVRIAVLHVWVFLIQQGVGTASAIAGQSTEFTWQKFLQDFIENTRLAITSWPHDWLLMTVFLLVWTSSAHPWERFFTRGYKPLLPNYENNTRQLEVTAPGAVPQKPRFRYYALAAALTGAVFFVALSWRK